MLTKYPNSLAKLEEDFARAAVSPITALARSLVEGAKAFDLKKTDNLGVNFRYKVNGEPIMRNYDNPVLFTLPEWNNAAILPGDYPVNPYMNTGMTGKGCLWHIGPNHAVDNGVLCIKPDETGEEQLYALGILRKFENLAPALAGGFAKFSRGADGEYIFDHAAIIQSKLEEFFEEMISGSISLLLEYTKENMTEEMEAHQKFAQVQALDPGFIERLRDKITNGKECFAGPALNDDRNTNNAWIETQLSWFMMDEQAWQEVKGDNPAFDYQLAAGDDAAGVVWHKITPELIDSSFASHGVLFSAMAASFLLYQQEKGINTPTSVVRQMENLRAHLHCR